MRIQSSSRDLSQLRADLAVAFVFEDELRPLGCQDRTLNRLLSRRMRDEGFKGRVGEVFVWSAADAHAAGRIALIGLGTATDEPLDAVRGACARAARLAPGYRAGSLAFRLPTGESNLVRAAVEGALAGAYTFERHLTDETRRTRPVESLTFSGGKGGAAVKRGVRAGSRSAGGTSLARDLVNESPSRLTPAIFAGIARKEARRTGLSCKVHGEAQLARMGMRALLEVTRGAASEAKVVHLVYKPKSKPKSKIVLVGKGVCFDSGGLSIKTATQMVTMKADMAGAAAVMGAMTTLADAGCPHEVHGLLGLVDNLIGADAYKPGDIIDTYAGKTVEVGNTDAEGRLVLCDLLAYAADKLSPDAVVDLATLTGACVVALGTQASGLFTRHDDLGRALREAAEAAGEKLWPLPMYEEYLALLQKGPADLHNVGGPWGGAITAALFLGEFLPREIPWAHLDIAGPAFNETDTPTTAAGGTGAAVATLSRWLERS